MSTLRRPAGSPGLWRPGPAERHRAWKSASGGGGGSSVQKYTWESTVLANCAGVPGNWYLLTEQFETFGAGNTVVDIMAGNAAGTTGSGSFNQPGIIPGSPFGSTVFDPGSYSSYSPGGSIGYSLADPYTMFAVFQTAGGASGPLGILGLWDTFGSSGTRASMYLNGSGYMVMGQDKSGGPFYTTTGATNLIDGKAHLALATWDGSTLKAYVDGAAIGSVAIPSTPSDLVFPWISYATAGAAGAGTVWNFNGNLQSCAIFTQAIASAQVAALWLASQI